MRNLGGRKEELERGESVGYFRSGLEGIEEEIK